MLDLQLCGGRLWPSAGHGRLGEPLLDEEEGQGECQASEPKQEAPEAPELPKARGALLRAAVAEDVALWHYFWTTLAERP